MLAVPAATQKAMDALLDLPEEDPYADREDEWQDEGVLRYEDVLSGEVPIAVSHGGGELGDWERDVSEELHGKKKRSAVRLLQHLI